MQAALSTAGLSGDSWIVLPIVLTLAVLYLAFRPGAAEGTAGKTGAARFGVTLFDHGVSVVSWQVSEFSIGSESRLLIRMPGTAHWVPICGTYSVELLSTSASQAGATTKMARFRVRLFSGGVEVASFLATEYDIGSATRIHIKVPGSSEWLPLCGTYSVEPANEHR